MLLKNKENNEFKIYDCCLIQQQLEISISNCYTKMPMPYDIRKQNTGKSELV